VKQVRNQAEEPQAPSEDDQFIFPAEFGEDVLLKLLQRTLSAEKAHLYMEAECHEYILGAETASPAHSVVQAA